MPAREKDTSKRTASQGGRTAHRTGRWDHLPQPWVVALFLLVALAVLYPGPLLQREVFLSADARNSDAFSLVGDAAFARGHYPLWNPYLFAGMPTFGSLTYTRLLYPPGVVLTFLQQHLGLPPLTWLLAHLIFGGLGMAYLLSRWRLPTAALVLGAVAWIAQPEVTAWAVHGHGSKLTTAMYLPWIVAAAWDILTGRGARAVGLCGLLLGLQILRGHIQITYYTLMVLGWLGLINAIWRLTPPASDGARSVRWRRTAGLAVAIGLGFAIGATLLLPVHDYARLSIRGQPAEGGGLDYNYATNWSFAPAELPTLVFPSAAGFGRGTYAGTMPFTDYPNYLGWLLLLLAITAWWRSDRRLMLALAGIFVVALLISFGRNGSPLYRLLYNHLPFFNKFRVPSMILILPAFVTAYLAACGATALAADDQERGRWWRRWLPRMLMILGGLLLVAGGTGLARGAFQAQLAGMAGKAGRPMGPALLEAAWRLQRGDLVRIGLVLLAAGSALLLSRRNPRFRRDGLLWTLAVLASIDLMTVDGRIAHPERGLVDVARDRNGRYQLYPASPLLEPYVPAQRTLGKGPAFEALAAAVGHDRVWPLGSWADRNDFMVAGIRSLGGYHPAKLAAYQTVRERLYNPEEPAARLAAWLSGKVVALSSELPDGAFPALRQLGCDLDPVPIFRDGMVLYANRSALPRARLLTRFALADTLPAARTLAGFLDRIQAGSWRPDQVVTLDRMPDPLPQTATAPEPAPEFLRDDLDEVVVRTTADGPAVLVLADMQNPGWQVWVDGMPATLLTADLILRGVALPGGRHEVRFRFHDPALARGLTLSGVGIAGVLLLLIWPLWRRKVQRRTPAASPPSAGGAVRDV